MFLVIALLVAFRYYSLQREDLNAVAAQLRDDLSADAIALYNLAYNSGARTRALYEEYLPKAQSLVARFRRDAE